MSEVHGMSDQEVEDALKKMVEFIMNDGRQKAKEINDKAEEEKSIEKSKIVREEVAVIDAQYEKKFKIASKSQQTTQSKLNNQTRLKVLAARQEVLDSIFEAAQSKLGEATQDKDKYQKILKNLMLEGFYALNEKKIQIRIRKADQELAQKAIEEAKTEYKENVHKDIEVTIDEKNYLPEGCAGGLSIVGGGGKIDINNTLDERLKLLEDTALPAIRTTLFGKNENRKFYD